jgi:hypothetical protein
MLTGVVMRAGDRYLVDWDADQVDAEAWLFFAGGEGGEAKNLTMAKVDPDADFSYDYEDLSFTRIGECTGR